MRGMMIWKSRSALALPEPSTYCDSALAAIGMTARAAVASKVLVSKRMVDVLRLKKLRISVGRVLAHDLARGVPGRYPCPSLSSGGSRVGNEGGSRGRVGG